MSFCGKSAPFSSQLTTKSSSASNTKANLLIRRLSAQENTFQLNEFSKSFLSFPPCGISVSVKIQGGGRDTANTGTPSLDGSVSVVEGANSGKWKLDRIKSSSAMSWKVTQLNGTGCDSPHAHTPTKEDNSLNARQENPDNLFEIVPKLLINGTENGTSDNSEIKGSAGKVFGKVILVTLTAGNSSGQSAANELVGIGFDKTFLILSKELDVVEKSIELTAPIDFLLWRKSVLLVGLASSEILILHPITFEKIASRKLSPTIIDEDCKQSFFHNAFIHPTANLTRIDLIAIGSNGDIYCFPNISLTEDDLDFTQEDSMVSINIDVSTIKGTIQRSCLDGKSKVIAACSPRGDVMITAQECGTVSSFTVEDKQVEEVGDTKSAKSRLYRQLIQDLCNRSTNVMHNLDPQEHGESCTVVKLVQCQSTLFMLFSNGHLHSVIDDMLLLTERMDLVPPDHLIHDFVFVIRQSGSIKLWIIYSDADRSGHFIAIHSSPHFERAEFNMRIPVSGIAKGYKSTFRFPAQATGMDEPTSFIEILDNSSTKIYHMSEVSTDISLQNLLDKGRFHKAELLAKKYLKDLDIVWKAKVEALANELILSHQKPNKNCQNIFDEMLKTLGLVRDTDWICGFIVKGKRIPRLEWVKELLALGLKRASECSGSENGQRFLLTRKKFYTFEQVLPNSGINQWTAFNDEKNTMLAQCIWFLENSEFQKCEIVWLRHSDEFISTMGISDLGRFFKVLFETQLRSEAAISLFKTMLPFAIDKCQVEGPDENSLSTKINGLINLIRSQLRSLEREKKWPTEAISFTNILIEVVSDEMKSLESEKDFGNSDPRRAERKASICGAILSKLQYLLQALNELAFMRKNHSILIPFDTYTNENIVEVVNSMLQELFGREEIQLFVNEFLRPFAARNDLDMDHLFKEHIKSSIEDLPYYEHASAIPFEERIITLVSFLGSTKCKLECILIIAEHWPVPWVPMLDDIVKGAVDTNLLKYGDDEYAELQEKIKWLRIQVPYRCLQRKYRLVPHKLVTGFGVQMALSRILTWRKPNYYEDCLELIKHTGKYNETDVRTLKFWLDLSCSDMPIEEVVPNGLTDVDLLRNFLDRVLVEFRGGKDSCYEEKDWQRFSECAHLISNRINDAKTLEFLKLRQLIPNLWNDEILESSSYPFSALELLLQAAHMKTSQEIIQDCNRLSVISFTNYKNLLVIAAAFFILPGPGSAFQKMWDLIEYAIQRDELLQDAEGDIVSKAGLSVVHELALQIPSLSNNQLLTFHEFCRLLANSFGDAIIEPLSKIFGILRIFETLREQEIPLEKEFMLIYKEVWREGIQKSSVLFNTLANLGEVVLRFGNKELHCQIFNAIQLELESQVRNSFGAGKQFLLDTASKVSELKNDLLSRASTLVEPETNPRVISLLKSLEEAGLPMNSYALRQRGKGKLIATLLEMGHFHLGAQTALIFAFKDAESWSNILKQYMWKGAISDLKAVLEALKKIPDLWVLEEFSAAWLKVSQEYPTFRHMCPIPLD